MASNEESRAWEHTILDGFFDGRVRAAAVSDTCETAMQHLCAYIWLAKEAHTLRVTEGFRQLIKSGYGDQMDMAVDEARADI